jgi:pimeloyl-ACP methyl ester carboxylesterase
MAKKVLKMVGIVLLGLLGVVLLLGLIPVSVPELPSSPEPAASYEEAIARFETAVSAEQGILMSPKSSSVLLTHGVPTEKVYVLIHGWTNSPFQWVDFGQMLYERGHNVLILRMPYHGLASQSVGELGSATPELVRDYADEVVDMAAGLGDEVHVIGLSVGGSVASWIAQNRADVSRVMSISPMYGIGRLPQFVDYFLLNFASRAPNFNPTSPSEPQREHVYRGQSSKGVANVMLFGKALFAQAAAAETAVTDLIVITNDNDTTVNNKRTDELTALWAEGVAAPLRFVFPKEAGFPHNSIDRTSNPEADAVYATLLELLGETPLTE